MAKLFDRCKGAAGRLIASSLLRRTPRNRKSLAIFKPDGIGDFVLTSAALGIMIAEHGPENVALIVSRDVAGLAALLFPNVEVLPITPGHARWPDKLRGLPALRAALRSKAYDEVLCLRHYRNLYETTILDMISTNRIVLLANQSQAGAARSTVPLSGKFHIVEPAFSTTSKGSMPRELQFHAAVLSASLGRRVEADTLRPDWDRWRTRRENSRPFLLISPLAGNSIRDVPPKLVEAAARTAAARGLARTVLTGSCSQALQLERYADGLRSALPGHDVEVVHPADLTALVTLVANSSLLVAAETSTAHMAAALDQPALLIIGGGHFGWFAPWSRSANQVWLTNPLPCFGCNWRCIHAAPLCITEITPAQVAASLPPAMTA